MLSQDFLRDHIAAHGADPRAWSGDAQLEASRHWMDESDGGASVFAHMALNHSFFSIMSLDSNLTDKSPETGDVYRVLGQLQMSVIMIQRGFWDHIEHDVIDQCDRFLEDNSKC